MSHLGDVVTNTFSGSIILAKRVLDYQTASILERQLLILTQDLNWISLTVQYWFWHFLPLHQQPSDFTCFVDFIEVGCLQKAVEQTRHLLYFWIFLTYLSHRFIFGLRIWQLTQTLYWAGTLWDFECLSLPWLWFRQALYLQWYSSRQETESRISYPEQCSHAPKAFLFTISSYRCRSLREWRKVC